jgi:hypothetical protein
MINICRILRGQQRNQMVTVTILLMLSPFISVVAQPPPPKPVTVTATTPTLSFGAFSQGATGGTVTIAATGGRSASGDVILLNLGYSFAAGHFEIVGEPGTVINMLNAPDVSITCTCGGSMNLHIGNSDPLTPFVITTTPPTPTIMTVGGVLTVGSPLANPPGSYSGTYSITFIQE